MFRLHAALWIAAGLLARDRAFAQESAATLQNPFTSDADVAAGEKYYMAQCASCHGRDGRGGGAGPDISSGNFKRATSDESLFQIINRGIPGTVMPGAPYNAGQVWRIVAFVRSLAIGRKNQAVTGDAARGSSVYASLGCAKCHTTSAPDLRGIGTKRTVTELRASILDPQAEVPSSYWRIRAAMRSGAAAQGFVMNEDTFSIQLLDSTGRLRSIRRADAVKIEYDRTSPMPSFRTRVSDPQLDDLIAFLISENPR